MTTRHLASIGFLLAGSAGAQTLHAGRLATGDDRLDGGEFADSYEVELRAGQRFEADLTSSDFDPYLILRAPSGAQEDNDDYLGSTTHSRIVTTAEETGTYTVAVTSYAAGETGDYRLALETGRAPVVTQPPPASSGDAPPTGGPLTGRAERAVAAGDLVGRWVGGAVTASQYRDRATGASAPTNGVGTTLDLLADGTYRQSRVLNQTSTSCTSTVHVDEEGAWAVEGGELVLRRQNGHSWGQTCGGPRYDRELGAETAWFAITVAPGRGGADALTRRQSGDIFDQLDRAD